MKTTVIYHRADFDGIFCREIAKKFLPDAELVGWDYGDEKLQFPSEGTVYVLDLSPDCFAEIPKYQERLIWIDHHKSAIEKYPSTIPGCRIDGVAACRLAWQWFTNVTANEVMSDPAYLPTKVEYFNRTVSEPVAVRLAGEYDIWDKRDPRVDTFQFGLRSATELDWDHLLYDGDSEFKGDDAMEYIARLLEAGQLLQRYQQEQDASIVKRGFDVEFEGRKFLALNIARCNSLTFESAAKPEHDGLMGFCWDGKQWCVSLYHTPFRKDIDLSQIAVKYGGGGHRGACGFRCSSLPFIKN